MASKLGFFTLFACFLLATRLVTSVESVTGYPESPAHAPTTPPYHNAPPPTTPPVNHGNCHNLCFSYCAEGYHSKRRCFRDCTACCKKLDCVPCNGQKCEGWTYVSHNGEQVKCPVTN